MTPLKKGAESEVLPCRFRTNATKLNQASGWICRIKELIKSNICCKDQVLFIDRQVSNR